MIGIILLILALMAGCTIFWLLQRPAFGRLPQGRRKEVMEQSPHYSAGIFRNQHPTPTVTDGSGLAGALAYFLFADKTGVVPRRKLPAVKSDLQHLSTRDYLVWFGHSSVLLGLDGKTILIDPVLSDRVSPVPGTLKAFRGTDSHRPQDLPWIDYLLISHDHWDHLDYDTVRALLHKTGRVCCPLGVRDTLERWGFEPEKIIERDWNGRFDTREGFTVHFTPSRHFSGRSFRRNHTQWCSYVLETPSLRIFYSGDGGYDTHFAEIGDAFGGFDLALLENGQYGEGWKYIHLFPQQTAEAARQLQAKAVLPVHWGRFALARHPWHEPVEEFGRYLEGSDIELWTPLIGEVVDMNHRRPAFDAWWKAFL